MQLQRRTSGFELLCQRFLSHFRQSGGDRRQHWRRHLRVAARFLPSPSLPQPATTRAFLFAQQRATGWIEDKNSGMMAQQPPAPPTALPGTPPPLPSGLLAATVLEAENALTAAVAASSPADESTNESGEAAIAASEATRKALVAFGAETFTPERWASLTTRAKVACINFARCFPRYQAAQGKPSKSAEPELWRWARLLRAGTGRSLPADLLQLFNRANEQLNPEEPGRQPSVPVALPEGVPQLSDIEAAAADSTRLQLVELGVNMSPARWLALGKDERVNCSTFVKQFPQLKQHGGAPPRKKTSLYHWAWNLHTGRRGRGMPPELMELFSATYLVAPSNPSPRTAARKRRRSGEAEDGNLSPSGQPPAPPATPPAAAHPPTNAAPAPKPAAPVFSPDDSKQMPESVVRAKLLELGLDYSGVRWIKLNRWARDALRSFVRFFPRYRELQGNCSLTSDPGVYDWSWRLRSGRRGKMLPDDALQLFRSVAGKLEDANRPTPMEEAVMKAAHDLHGEHGKMDSEVAAALGAPASPGVSVNGAPGAGPVGGVPGEYVPLEAGLLPPGVADGSAGSHAGLHAVAAALSSATAEGLDAGVIPQATHGGP